MSLPAWREEPILKSAKGAARTNILEHFALHSVLRVFLKSAKGAARTNILYKEHFAPHSVLRVFLKSAKGAARTNVLYKEHFAPHSVLRVFLKRHDRESFNCGDPAMNDFLQRYARQSHESGAAKTFLAIDKTDDRTILGFYSLAPGSLAYADTPEIVRRGLARHDVPGFRLARIATDLRWRGVKVSAADFSRVPLAAACGLLLKSGALC